MYIRMQHVHLDPTRARDFEHFTKRDLIPRLRRMSGFRSYRMLGDLTSGQALEVTEWNTERQAQSQLMAVRPAPEAEDFDLDYTDVEVFEVVAQAELPREELIPARNLPRRFPLAA
jgi:hypothetical protein